MINQVPKIYRKEFKIDKKIIKFLIYEPIYKFHYADNFSSLSTCKYCTYLKGFALSNTIKIKNSFIRYYKENDENMLFEISLYTIFGYSYFQNFLQEKKLYQIEFMRNELIFKNKYLYKLEKDYFEAEDALNYIYEYNNFEIVIPKSKSNVLLKIINLFFSFFFFILGIIIIIFGFLFSFNIDVLENIFSSGLLIEGNISHLSDLSLDINSIFFKISLTNLHLGIFIIIFGTSFLLLSIFLFLNFFLKNKYSNLLIKIKKDKIQNKKTYLNEIETEIKKEKYKILDEAKRIQF